MSNRYDCKLFSHTSYAIHTNHQHHTYEKPKQYYSIQCSHTFNNDNIVLPCIKISVTATSLKKISHDSYVIGHAHRRDFPVIYLIQNATTEQASYQ
jgi:hypothetical protein